MATEWYYQKDGERCGPVSSAELGRMASSGQVLADSLIWKEGLTSWVQASKVKGLTFAQGNAPAVMPPPVLGNAASSDFDFTESAPTSPPIKKPKPNDATIKIAVVCIAVFAALAALTIYGMDGLGSGKTGPVQIVFGLIMLVCIAASYFLPSIIAKSRGHQNFVAIAALNLLLGLTGVGWVLALIWSLTEVRAQSVVHHHHHGE